MSIEEENTRAPTVAEVEAYDTLLDLAAHLDREAGNFLFATLARLLRATALAVSLGSLEALMAGTRAVGQGLEKYGAGDGDPN